MKVLMLSTDKKIFEEASLVGERMKEYGSLFDELHVVVFTRGGFSSKKLAPNVWVYGTNSRHPFLYVWDGYGVCEAILKQGGEWIVSSQDAIGNILVSLLRKQFSFSFQMQIHADIMSPHFMEESSIKRRLYRHGYRLGLCYADCIRVMSSRIARSLSKDSYVLPVYTDIEKFISAPRSSFLSEHYPQCKYFLLTVSRLAPEKNIKLLIDVVKDLSEEGLPVGLIIVGDGSLRKDLENYRDNLGLGDRVILAGAAEDLLPFYSSAHLYVQASNHEGYGLSLLEAAASGLPIVATNVGLVGEVLLPDSSLLVCEPGDKNCFTSSVQKLIHDVSLAKTLGAHAKDRAREVVISKEEYLRRYKESFTQCHIKEKN